MEPYRSISNPLIKGARGNRIGWFRICGYGLAWRDHTIWPPLLSERYNGQHGFRQKVYVHWGTWCVRLITRRNP